MGTPRQERRSRATHLAARRYVVALFVTAATTASLLGAPAAGAVGSGTTQSRLTNPVPTTLTPDVADGTVYAITKVNGLTILGGNFTGASNQGSSTTLPRSGLLAFNASNGRLSTTFAPQLDGTVQAVAPGPYANTVYVGGYFNNVNGVRSKGITLLSTRTGAILAGFAPQPLNGPVLTIATSRNHLFIAGGFSLVGSNIRRGIASLDPRTGVADSYLDVSLVGHHNYDGSGAQGALGGRALAINPAATRLVVVGNFTSADGLDRDQVALIDLDTSSATVDRNWATQRFTAACARASFDTYLTDVQYAPNGSYFAITTTGGKDTVNSDGSRGLCDAASRWDSADTGTAVAPVWVDYTGNDTLWSVATTGTAVYVGGHQRWLNNSNAIDAAGPGSVPRPGIAALDPLSGIPLSWNPGHNPRGAGVYALLASTNGLYAGSDANFFGNFRYNRPKIGFFQLAGGAAAAPTTVASLPGKLYLAGPLAGQDGLGVDDLGYRSVNGTSIRPTVTLTPRLAWSRTHGAFVVGRTLFYATEAGNFYRAPFNGTTVGQPVRLQAYNDPAWSSVQTGSGETYEGVQPGYYDEISSVTGAFYSAGRLFYTLAGQRSLYWRWFSPDSGIIGADEFTITGADFRDVQGITASGDTLYYAKSDGTLHTMSFAGLTLDPSTDAVFSGPGKDSLNWRARNLFLYG